MRKATWVCYTFALTVMAGTANANMITVNDAGDAGPGNCTSTCTLRDAIATATSGDTITFSPSLASPIALTQGELLIAKALTITGPGAAALTISAQNASRVFDIAANATITDLGIADGAVAGSNDTNSDGGAGGSVGGACVLVDGGITAVLDRVVVRHCYATGGSGGRGADGSPGVGPPPAFGGTGGTGGNGGDAVGAAVAVNGSLSLFDSSVLDAHATGGIAGNGGNGGSGTPPGFAGQGGVGGAAEGGAVAVSGGSLRIVNSTITASSGNGGSGGAAGSGTSGFPGGIGGYAAGGLLYVDNSATLADLEFSTLVNGSVAGGAAGPGGPIGGTPVANAIVAGSTLNVLSSIVVGAQSGTELCYGPVTAATGSANVSETTNNTANGSSCNDFSVNATLAQILKSVDTSATPAYMPIWNSPAIDAATNCQDLASQTVTADQHGTLRPQGNACDLGAIEADYIFVDGFDG